MAAPGDGAAKHDSVTGLLLVSYNVGDIDIDSDGKETTAGPFDPSRTAFPDWAPDGGDAAAVLAYVAKTGMLAAEHLARK